MHPSKLIPAHRLRAQAAAAKSKRKRPIVAKSKPAPAHAEPFKALVDRLKDGGA